MHNGIQIRTSAANRVYFATSEMPSSKMISKTAKENLYTCYLCPVVIVRV